MTSYFYRFDTQVKGRWAGRTLIDVMSNEFIMKPVEYYDKAIQIGNITVNSEECSKYHILSLGETIQHLVHYHEPDLCDIGVLCLEDDYLVVNKPSGIACHPTSGYNLFSVTKAFESYGNLSCINRLDVLTSGVLILAFRNAKKYHTEMINRRIEKIYVAKVKGHFHDDITVNAPLKKNRFNVTEVSEEGKEATTVFKRLFYHNGHSLVECRPLTGRSHQIRVHLKSLNFPIVNDPVYNGEVSDIPDKSVVGKENHLLSSGEYIDYGVKYSGKDTNTDNQGELNSTKKQAKAYNLLGCTLKIGCNTPGNYSAKEKFAIDSCRGDNTRAFRNMDKFICLHAHKYVFNGKEYVAEPPFWAQKDNF
ncbi:RluA family pseudouridine synthase [Vavraia culicis subsp. floridensis]|uniref:RluA family pseudouridine synthase n=1 Tax=Vavraia culicis (isolate floridensis) TaxID=948595 RepID=L2GV26_VAVCU|nr:RluA family pseudouridine synthase [Vavraia culicis subsp. floridensis]ELA47222.1 RluA family pseudouridine synthase [Vavraia culicis subsp. floridensis]